MDRPSRDVDRPEADAPPEPRDDAAPPQARRAKALAKAPEAKAPEPAAAADPKEAARQRKRARVRRMRLVFFLVVFAVLVGGAAAAYWFFVASRFESTDDAFVDGEIVRLSPQLAGVLLEVPARENGRVKPGDVLARIDPKEVEAQLALDEASLAQALSAVGAAAAQVAQAEAQAAAQQSARDAAAVRRENAQASASRYTTLSGRSGQLAISQQAVDDAVAAAREADAALAQAEATLREARAAVETAQAQRATAEAEVEAARATVAQAKVQLGYATVVAPISGQVVQLDVNRGSYVAPGSQMMAIVPDDLHVTANFKETQLDGVRVGQAVDVRVDAFPEVKFRGRVDSIQRGAGQAFALLPPQNATGNFVKVVQRVPVRIEIVDGPSFRDYPIGPGMSVVPRVHIR